MAMAFMISFLVLLSVGVPISMVMGASSLIYIILNGQLSMTIVVQTLFSGMASFPLLAIPLFMLAGNLMNEFGITHALVRFTRLLIGFVRGGVGISTVLACAFFSAISGSAVATAVAIGSIMIPAMKEIGYDDDIAAALTATSACMGPIIPPSIPFIIYGSIANVSIGGLFIAGVIPGLLLGAGMVIYIYFVAYKRKYPVDERANIKEIAVGTWQALPCLMMPVIVLGGIMGGVFTPTEAAGIAVFYSILVGIIFYRKNIKISKLPNLLVKSGLETAMVMLLLGLSEPFAWVTAVEHVPDLLLGALSSFSSNPYVVLIMVNIGLIIIGIPLETVPALAICTPILAPLAVQLGVSPIQLGIVICFNLVLGLITPPVGGVLFSICGTSGISLEKLSKAIWIPFLISLVVLLLITMIPSLTTFLPNMFGYY